MYGELLLVGQECFNGFDGRGPGTEAPRSFAKVCILRSILSVAETCEDILRGGTFDIPTANRKLHQMDMVEQHCAMLCFERQKTLAAIEFLYHL